MLGSKRKRVCNTVKENDCDNVEKFLNTLPHYYYEENNLHMFLIMQMRDYDTALAYLEAFLPYIDINSSPPYLAQKILPGTLCFRRNFRQMAFQALISGQMSVMILEEIEYP